MRYDRMLAVLPALFGLTAALPAKADLRMVQVVTTSGHYGAAPRKMTLTPPPLGAAPGTADNTVRVTLSVHGAQSRADDGPYSTIIDRATKRETFLDRTHRTYVQADWDATTESGPPGVSLDVHRTGSAARMVGHPAHEYVLSGTLDGYPVSGTVWTADDVTQPAIPSALGGPSTPAWTDKLPGLVLKMDLFLGVPGTSATGTLDTPVTWHLQTKTVALTAAPLPASTFAVPAGYKTLKSAPKQ